MQVHGFVVVCNARCVHTFLPVPPLVAAISLCINGTMGEPAPSLSPASFPQPPAGSKPVEDGWKCRTDGCPFACKSQSTMSKHRSTQAHSAQATEAKVQQHLCPVGDGKGRRWVFVWVDPSVAREDTPPLTHREQVLASFRSARKLPQSRIATLAREADDSSAPHFQFYVHLGWFKRFDPAALQKLLDATGGNSIDHFWFESAKIYVTRASAKAEQLVPSVRKRLVGKFPYKLFGLEGKTVDERARIVGRLFFFLCDGKRPVQASGAVAGGPVPCEAAGVADWCHNQLLGALADHVPDFMSSDYSTWPRVLRFARCMAPLFSAGSVGLRAPPSLRHALLAIHFVCRLAIVWQASQSQRSSAGAIDESYPPAFRASLSVLASWNEACAETEGGQSLNGQWVGDVFICGSARLSASSVRQAISTIQSQCRQSMEGLRSDLWPDRPHQPFDLSKIKDNWGESGLEPELGLLYHSQRHTQALRQSALEAGERFCKEGKNWRSLGRRLDQLLGKVHVLLHVVGGGPPRMTGAREYRVRGRHSRDIFLFRSGLMLVQRRVPKLEWSTHSSSGALITRHLDAAVSALFFEYLFRFRSLHQHCYQTLATAACERQCGAPGCGVALGSAAVELSGGSGQEDFVGEGEWAPRAVAGVCVAAVGVQDAFDFLLVRGGRRSSAAHLRNSFKSVLQGGGIPNVGVAVYRQFHNALFQLGATIDSTSALSQFVHPSDRPGSVFAALTTIPGSVAAFSSLVLDPLASQSAHAPSTSFSSYAKTPLNRPGRNAFLCERDRSVSSFWRTACLGLGAQPLCGCGQFPVYQPPGCESLVPLCLLCRVDISVRVEKQGRLQASDIPVASSAGVAGSLAGRPSPPLRAPPLSLHTARVSSSPPLLNLKLFFGFDRFLEGQHECLQQLYRSFTAGQDVLVQAPTAFGKTIVSLLHALKVGGVSVFVCPLRPLVRDHLQKLQCSGFPVFEFASSTDLQSLFFSDATRPLAPCVVFVSPLQLAHNSFGTFINSLAHSGLVKCIIVDEAHRLLADVQYRVGPSLVRSLRAVVPDVQVSFDSPLSFPFFLFVFFSFLNCYCLSGFVLCPFL